MAGEGLNITIMGSKKMQKLLSSIGISKKALSARSTEAFTTLVQTIKPAVCWEVGDTIGAYAWLVLEHSSTCKAILFEANSDNYLDLLKTIHRKQLHRAEAHNIVVSPVSAGMVADVNATAVTVGAMPRIASSGRKTTLPITVQHGAYAMERDAVDRLTLNELLVRGHMSPDIIKLDTQDAERLVIEGARQVLEACSPLLIVKTATPKLVHYLEGLSYRSFPFDQDNTIFISVYF